MQYFLSFAEAKINNAPYFLQTTRKTMQWPGILGVGKLSSHWKEVNFVYILVTKAVENVKLQVQKIFF